MAEITINNNASAASTLSDADIRAQRQKTYSKIMWGPTLSSAAQMMAMFGGPMLGAGLLALIGMGSGAVSAAAVVVTAVGATLSIASIITNYIGTRCQNDGWLDQTEMSAMNNAKYLVKELKANNMCLLQEHEQNCRADGKSWQQMVANSPELVVSR